MNKKIEQKEEIKELAFNRDGIRKALDRSVARDELSGEVEAEEGQDD